jgi:hypothetical protein
MLILIGICQFVWLKIFFYCHWSYGAYLVIWNVSCVCVCSYCLRHTMLGVYIGLCAMMCCWGCFLCVGSTKVKLLVQRTKKWSNLKLQKFSLLYSENNCVLSWLWACRGFLDLCLTVDEIYLVYSPLWGVMYHGAAVQLCFNRPSCKQAYKW